ncbi:MAG: SDR family oxidoreductase [Candidatus Eisenbacteria bacterium]|nr:SDR family oxidoreductase [Candidatus Eisenbacteria bacterium]MCC7143837.1 SDR family oxidoreductase [Candidatus Eisenbacteria bacterium]
MIDLSGQIALVTGGSRGIGGACSRLLARAGADVVVHFRKQAQPALETVAAIEAMGRRSFPIATDVMNPIYVNAMVDQIGERMGGLDLVVLNAGIWTNGAIDTMTDADWARMIGVNLTGCFHVARATVPLLKARGGGSLIFITSTAGQRGEAFHSHYAATKGALIAMVRSLAVELAPNIRVNAVSPGWIRTSMTEHLLTPQAIGTSLKEPIPLGRPGEPEDVAGPVVFLASSLARHITGAILNVNGGSVLV